MFAALCGHTHRNLSFRCQYVSLKRPLARDKDRQTGLNNEDKCATRRSGCPGYILYIGAELVLGVADAHTHFVYLYHYVSLMRSTWADRSWDSATATSAFSFLSFCLKINLHGPKLSKQDKSINAFLDMIEFKAHVSRCNVTCYLSLKSIKLEIRPVRIKKEETKKWSGFNNTSIFRKLLFIIIITNKEV